MTETTLTAEQEARVARIKALTDAERENVLFLLAVSDGPRVDLMLSAVSAPARCPAGECNGYGEVIVDGCTCGAGPGGYYGIHERCCGSEPCPAGCAYVPHPERTELVKEG